MSTCTECGFEHAMDGTCAICPPVPVALSAVASATPPSKPFRTGAALRFLASFALPSLLALSVVALGLAAYLSLPASGDPVEAGLEAAAPNPASSETPATGEPPVSRQRAGELAPMRPQRLLVAFGRPQPPDINLDADPVRKISVESPVSKAHPPTGSFEEYLAWMLANTKEEAVQLERKWARSRELLARGEIHHTAVLEAFLYTPREYFARSYNAKKAYDDTAIPIGHGQTISGPHMVSHMTDTIAPLRGDRILEIGTGSGYQSALLSELSDQVYTIEIVAALAAETDAIYRKLEKGYPEYSVVRRKNADGYFGWPEFAPFDKIIVTAGIDHIPPPLLAQLAPGGIMVIPVGPPSGQTVLKVVKRPLEGGGFAFDRSDIYQGRKVIFVPFTADGGSRHSLDDAKVSP